MTTSTPGRSAGRDDARGDGGEAVGGDAVAFGDDAAELRLRLLVDLADAGAGQDVVELVAQQHPPLRLERGRQRLAEERRHAAEGLGGDQRPLGAAVQELGAALGGQGAAVELEVHLADPDRQRGVLVHGGVGLGEPVGDLDRAERGHDGEVGELPLAVEHLLGRAAAAVAVAEGEQALGEGVLAAIVLPGLDDGARAGLGVVAADRVVEGVGEHAAAVEALPPEEVGGHGVGLGPVHLDGEEARHPGLVQQLRQRGREAEAVGQPADGVPLAEHPLEVALAVEELADEGLAGRHVGVGLDPHGAVRLPLAGGDLLLDAGEERRVVLLEVGVELGGRLVEDEVRVAVHQRQHGREGAGGLAPRLGQRPEPGEVDMRVPGQRQRAVLRVAVAQLPQPLAESIAPRCADRVALRRRRGRPARVSRSAGSCQIRCDSALGATRAM